MRISDPRGLFFVAAAVISDVVTAIVRVEQRPLGPMYTAGT